MKRLLFIFLTLFTTDAFCREVSFEELHQLAAPGRSVVIEEELLVSGVVISIPKHENLADGVQINFRSNSSTQNNRTAYMQSPDGSLGVRLVFQHFDPEGQKAARYSRLKLSLKGCTVRRGHKGDVSIEDIPNGAVMEVVAGQASDIPVKSRTVRELTAAHMDHVEGLRIRFQGRSLHEHSGELCPSQSGQQPVQAEQLYGHMADLALRQQCNTILYGDKLQNTMEAQRQGRTSRQGGYLRYTCGFRQPTIRQDGPLADQTT